MTEWKEYTGSDEQITEMRETITGRSEMNAHIIEYYRRRLIASMKRQRMYLCWSNGKRLERKEGLK